MCSGTPNEGGLTRSENFAIVHPTQNKSFRNSSQHLHNSRKLPLNSHRASLPLRAILEKDERNQELSGTPNPGIFSKVTLVQMGGVLRYKSEVYCGVSLSSRLRSQQGIALQMGGVLQYKLDVCCQYFSEKLYGLGVPEQCARNATEGTSKRKALNRYRKFPLLQYHHWGFPVCGPA